MICYAMFDSNSRKERLASFKTVESKIPVITFYYFLLIIISGCKRSSLTIQAKKIWQYLFGRSCRSTRTRSETWTASKAVASKTRKASIRGLERKTRTKEKTKLGTLIKIYFIKAILIALSFYRLFFYLTKV